ncbi:MAG: adenylate/guanylate cyclase domain-containing protein [Phototrophicaceae bacterium]
MSQDPSISTAGMIHELSQAQALLEQVTTSLNAQKEILKQRGMNLPPMVMMALQSIQADLNKLETNVVEEQTELGQLQALADMSASITTSLKTDNVLEETMDIVIALTRAERGYILLLQDDGSFHFRVIRDATLKPGQSVTDKEPQISTTVLQEVVNTGQALLADNAFQDERFAGGASIANFSLRSVLCVPLMYKGSLIGLVYVDNRLQASIFTEREKQTLMAFANTAAVAIANARYYAEIQDSLEQITQVQELMANVFESIGSGLIATNADDVITTFNRAAQEILAWQAPQAVGVPLQNVLSRITTSLEEELMEIRDAEESHTLDAEIPRADGRRVAISMKLSPLRDSDRTVRGVAIVMDDVTSKREQEQQLRVMKTYLPPEMVDQIHEISQLDLGGVRREVTCLFAEVRPLSSMKENAPKEIMDILNEYLGIAADCVAETGGIVDKFMGNEIMAIWNTQLNRIDNHAEKAIQCALLMRDRFHQLYLDKGLADDTRWYRIGMHTGAATLGNVGSTNRRDFTAIGDTINLSKRLEENTTAGQIILSEDTYKQLQSNGDQSGFRFEDSPPILGKGKSTATQVYEVFRADG